MGQYGTQIEAWAPLAEGKEENFQIFDFSLSKEELEEIELLDRSKTMFPSYIDNETGAWLRSTEIKITRRKSS